MTTMLKQWMKRATAEQQQELADMVSTSRAYLYHLSAPAGKRYAREPSPQLAALIEQASAELAKKYPGLPVLYRTDLATPCRECAFAQRCLGAVALRADFDSLSPELTD